MIETLGYGWAPIILSERMISTRKRVGGCVARMSRSNVTHVEATQIRDGAAVKTDAGLRLRVEVLDALMAKKGINSVAGTARAAGISVATMFRLRGAKNGANLRTATRLASAAGTSVDALFEQRAI